MGLIDTEEGGSCLSTLPPETEDGSETSDSVTEEVGTIGAIEEISALADRDLGRGSTSDRAGARSAREDLGGLGGTITLSTWRRRRQSRGPWWRRPICQDTGTCRLGYNWNRPSVYSHIDTSQIRVESLLCVEALVQTKASMDRHATTTERLCDNGPLLAINPL